LETPTARGLPGPAASGLDFEVSSGNVNLKLKFKFEYARAH
jgi:hypothetical protein